MSTSQDSCQETTEAQGGTRSDDRTPQVLTWGSDSGSKGLIAQCVEELEE